MFLDDFVESLRLTEADRLSLKQKRGFIDATIDSFKFKSCGLYIRDLVSQFDDKDLKHNKIIDDRGDVAKQLLRPNILIPYLNRDGGVYKIRPHKFGFKGDPIAPYCEFLLDPEARNLVITEGEFKATAGFQYGLNCVAVPGIQSYSKNYFEDLITFLSGSKVKNIYIMFDREIKDDPKFSNFKKDWKSRHDTELYSYIMAQKFEKEKYNVFISEFPEEWMIDGKIDIDGCLANGRSKKDMESLLTNAKHPKDYLKILKDRHDPKVFSYINRRIKRSEVDTKIIRKFNKYYYLKDSNDEVEISNFVVDIVSTYFNVADNNILREIIITNEFGERAPPMLLDPEEMTSKAGFMKYCYSQGNYIFKGNDRQLIEIWQWEFMSDEGRAIVELDHVGKVDHAMFKGKDIWVTQDLMFYGDEEINPDENGVFWIDDLDKGVRLRMLDGGSDSGSCEVPKLNTEIMDLDEALKKFQGIAGYTANLMFGWVIFTLVHTYLDKTKIAPFPMLYGEKATGKTTICGAIMSLFGMPDYGSTMTDITTVAITRLMGYYSSLPVWLDEFNNSPKVMQKEGHLKAVYNRVPIIKGTRNQFGVASYKIRSHLMMSGETIPVSDGLKTRSVLLHTKLAPGGYDSLKWIETHKAELSYFMYYVLKNRHEIAEKAAVCIEEYHEGIVNSVEGIDIRTAKHYSIFAGCYRAMFPKCEYFHDWLTEKVLDQKDTVVQDEVHQFLEDIAVLYADGKITTDYINIGWKGQEIEIYIWFNGVYDAWREKYHRHKEIHSKTVLKKSLKTRAYCKGEQTCKLRESRRGAVVLDYSLCPDQLKDLADSLITRREFTLPEAKDLIAS